MRLTFFICLFCAFQSFAIISYSQSQRLSINQKNVSIESVIQLIEDKTDYYFMYSTLTIDVKRTVDIEGSNKLVSEILDEIFKGTDISYKIDGRLIALTKNGEASSIQQKIRSVSGKVTDSSNVPLPGVSVLIKNSSAGTVTGIDGSYNLANVPGNAILVFSFVGMKNQEVPVSGKNVINITMTEETVGLDEVVAVGYVSQKKSLLTGSISTMNVKNELKNLPTTAAGNLIIGRLSGVSVSTVNGVPGSNPTISVRTASSWNSQPVVYVIDGVVRDADYFNNLSPNEIDVITVLKDAAASAIYGSRSAGGVILVTTKRGETGKPVFNYSYNTGFDTRTKNTSLTDAVQTGELYNRYNPSSDPAGWKWSQEELDYYKNVNNGWGYSQLDAVWRTPSRQTHSLTVSGGSEKIKYFAGASYISQKAFLKPSKYDKYNFRLNVTADLSKNLQFFAGVELMNSLKGVTIWEGDDALYAKLLRWQPDQPVYTKGGKFADYGWTANVGAVVNGDGGYDKYNYLQPQITLSATYKLPFIDGLKAKAGFSKDYNYTRRKLFIEKYLMYKLARSGANNHIVDLDEANATGTKWSSNYSSEYLYGKTSWDNDYQLNLELNYDHVFNKVHHVQGALVFERAESDVGGLYAQNRTFPVYKTDQWWATSTSDSNNSSGGDADQTTGRASYIGQFNYDYANKYLINFSFREDGSMKFSSGNRWGFFPAGSIGWVISEEPFFSDIAGEIDHLKIRASAGLTGNDNVGGWQWQESYTTGNSAYFGTSPSQSTGITYGSIVNKNLTWEKALTYNIGADMNFMKHWSSSIEYWFKKSYDILGSRNATLPTTFSQSMPDENYGQINAQGFDFSLGYRNKWGSLEYYMNFTASYGWNKVIKKDYAENALKYSIPVDKSTNYISGLKFDKILRTADDVTNFVNENPKYTFFGISPEIGMPVYKDLDGPDGVPDGTISSYDFTVLRKNNFPVNYGLNLGASWKGISIDMLFSGKLKEQKSFQDLAGGVEWNRIWNKWYNNSWTADNPNGWLPRRYGYFDSKFNVNSEYLSSYWLKDDSFIRLKYLNIGYTVPQRFYKNVFDRMKIYFSGTNLFVLSRFTYYDPEISNGVYYPVMRSFNFGIDVTF